MERAGELANGDKLLNKPEFNLWLNDYAKHFHVVGCD
jgi:hypothetical protein|tara:strand:- start:535 stop:645 length:111 start_codon:yes stop_codon:yes gene_type:complete